VVKLGLGFQLGRGSLNYGHLQIISGLSDEVLAPPIARDAVLPQHLAEAGGTEQRQMPFHHAQRAGVQPNQRSNHKMKIASA
jgi:hypothetical protein